MKFRAGKLSVEVLKSSEIYRMFKQGLIRLQFGLMTVAANAAKVCRRKSESSTVTTANRFGEQLIFLICSIFVVARRKFVYNPAFTILRFKFDYCLV